MKVLLVFVFCEIFYSRAMLKFIAFKRSILYSSISVQKNILNHQYSPTVRSFSNYFKPLNNGKGTFDKEEREDSFPKNATNNNFEASFIEKWKSPQVKKDNIVHPQPWNFNEVPYSFVKESFLAYKKLHGNLLIPVEFVVPLDDTATCPPLVGGIKLGEIMHDIRYHDLYKEHKAELLTLGVDFDEDLVDFEVIKQSLLAYAEHFGNVNRIPKPFVIAKDDFRFPEAIRGKNLGRTIDIIKVICNYRAFRAELIALGITFSYCPIPFQKFKNVLMQYKDINGNLLVHSDFKIPHNDERYTKEVRGLRLGNISIIFEVVIYIKKLNSNTS